MIKFTPSLIEDVPQIAEWTAADPWHQNQNDPPWWLTGQGILAGCIEDDAGPVFYFRFDLEKELARMSTQFAPENQVSKKRVAIAISEALPIAIPFLKAKGAKGIVYESSAPELIKFMMKLGFGCLPGGKEALDEYLLEFKES